MFTGENKIHVRYAETDKMGVVYYANYLVWFEVARTAFLKAIGIDYKKVEQKGIAFAVIDARCQYLLPSFFDDEINIQTKITKLKRLKIEFEYKLYRNDALVATGSTVLGCVNMEGKPRAMPANVYKKLKDASN